MSRTETKRWGIGRRWVSGTRMGVFEGRISSLRPDSVRYWASASAWKVLTRTPGKPSAASRDPISRAALSVKVTARMRSGR